MMAMTNSSTLASLSLEDKEAMETNLQKKNVPVKSRSVMRFPFVASQYLQDIYASKSGLWLIAVYEVRHVGNQDSTGVIKLFANPHLETEDMPSALSSIDVDFDPLSCSVSLDEKTCVIFGFQTQFLNTFATNDIAMIASISIHTGADKPFLSLSSSKPFDWLCNNDEHRDDHYMEVLSQKNDILLILSSYHVLLYSLKDFKVQHLVCDPTLYKDTVTSADFKSNGNVMLLNGFLQFYEYDVTNSLIVNHGRPMGAFDISGFYSIFIRQCYENRPDTYFVFSKTWGTIYTLVEDQTSSLVIEDVQQLNDITKGDLEEEKIVTCESIYFTSKYCYFLLREHVVHQRKFDIYRVCVNDISKDILRFTFSDLHYKDPALMVVSKCKQIKNVREVFLANNTMISGYKVPPDEFSLRYLCKVVVNSLYDTEEIKKLDVPKYLKTYLLI